MTPKVLYYGNTLKITSMTQNKILSCLFQDSDLSFNKLQESTLISPKTLKKHLDELKCNKLVLEKGRDEWKHGKRLRYALTEKGKKEYVKQSLGNINDAMDTIMSLFPLLNKENLLALRDILLEQPFKVGGVEFERAAEDDNLKKQRLDKTFDEFTADFKRFYDSFINFYGEWTQISY